MIVDKKKKPNKRKAKKERMRRANELYHKGSQLASIRSTLTGTSNNLHIKEIEQLHSCENLHNYYFIRTGVEIKCIIIGLIKNDLPLIQCAHLRVGSSQLSELLSCTYTINDSHRYYNTAKDRHAGAYAEHASSIQFGYQRTIKECRSPLKLPFISATPDFVLEDRLVEVKSHQSIKNVQKENILQLLVSMEIFGKFYGEIHMYTMVKEGDIVKSVTLHQIYAIIKKATIFTPNFVRYASQGYINYLSTLLRSINISPSIKSLSQGIKWLMANAQIQNDESVILTSVPTTQLCLKTLSKVKTPKPGNKRKRLTFLWSQSAANFKYFREKESTYHQQVCEIIQNKQYNIATYDKIASNYISSDTEVTLEQFIDYSGRLTYQRPPFQAELNVQIKISDTFKKTAFVYDVADIENLLKAYFPIECFGELTDDYNFLKIDATRT